MSPSRTSTLILALGAAHASPALANGRFPMAQQLAVDAENPDHMALRSTFGLLLSNDGGAHWSWICEAAVGYGGYEDPTISIASSGRLIVGTNRGLVTSEDGGCTWTAVAETVDAQVVDVSVAAKNPLEVVALTSRLDDSGERNEEVLLSTSGGATWAPLAQLPAELEASTTLDVAPSDPDRLYVTGMIFGDGALHDVLLRSDDRGAHFSSHEIPETSGKAPPFLAAVHPTDANRLFVRVDAPVADGDALFESADGGATWTEVFRHRAKLFGFALSPDGGTILAGYGDPKLTTAIDRSVLGVWRGATSSLAFEHVYEEPVDCLRWTAAGIYACSPRFGDLYGLGHSTDGGASFRTLADARNLTGPLECGAEVARQCAKSWATTCPLFDLCSSEGPLDASVGEEPLDGGGTGEVEAAVPRPEGGRPSGAQCGCGAPGRRRGGAAAAAGALAALLAAVRRTAGRRNGARR